MEPEKITQPGKSSNNTWRIATIVLAVMLAVFAAVVAVSLGTGKVNVDTKTSGQNSTARQTICGDADVEKYNDPIMAEKPLKDYIDQFDALYDDINDRDGNEQDATCQYLLYSIAFLNNDETWETHADNVKTLNAKGNFVNNKIYQLRDVANMGMGL